MPTTVQFRRGTSSQNDQYTGANGEITFDFTGKNLRVHDNVTTGGVRLVTTSNHIIPTSNSSYDLGNSNYRYEELYLSNTFNLGNIKLKDGGSSLQILDGADNIVFTAGGGSGVASVGGSSGTISNSQVATFVKDLISTSNVSEGANLYFTNARSRAALSSGTGVYVNQSTGQISISQNVSTTSDVTFANLIVTGNILVQGNSVQFQSNTLVVNDPLIQMGVNPVGDTFDLGFFGHYIGGSPSIERHAGLFRDASDGNFKLFTNLDPEPTNIVDTSNTSYQNANIVVNFVIGKVTDISNHSTTTLSEGSNLYFTNTRAIGSLTAGSGISIAANGLVTSTALGGVTSVGGSTGAISNAQLACSIISSGVLNTANVVEGSNLYFTNTRVVSALTAGSNISIAANGLITALTQGGGGGGGVTVGNDTSSTTSTFYPLLSANTISGSLSLANVSTTKLYFQPSTGTLSATVLNSLSDLSKKVDIVKITNATELVRGINGYEFKWADNGLKSSGVIAQYIEHVLPHLVETNEQNIKSVNYSGIIAYLIETIRELDQRIQILENK
jgi:hypothetical protein